MTDDVYRRNNDIHDNQGRLYSLHGGVYCNLTSDKS